MMTPEKALELYNGIAGVIARRNEAGIYTAMGYSSNLDLLLDFQTGKLNALLEAYVPDGILTDMKPAPLITD